MVYALKDTNVNNGVMQAKGTDIPVSTGAVTNATDLRSLYLVPSLQELVSIDKIVLAAPDNASVAVYHVASIDLVPGVSATINTTDGQTIIVDSSGIHGVSVSPTGRRLLFSFGSIGSTLGGIGSTLSGGLNNLGNTITGLGNNLGNEITGSITNLGNDITGAVGTISNFATNSFNTVESGIMNFITLVQSAINGANPCCGAESGLQQAVAQLNAVYPNATAAVNQVTSLVNQYSSYASEICANSQVQSLISTVNNIVTKLDGALNQGGSNGLGSLIKQAIASTQCCQVVNSYIGQLKTIDSNFHTLQSDLSSACPPAVVAG